MSKKLITLLVGLAVGLTASFFVFRQSTENPRPATGQRQELAEAERKLAEQKAQNKQKEAELFRARLILQTSQELLASSQGQSTVKVGNNSYSLEQLKNDIDLRQKQTEVLVKAVERDKNDLAQLSKRQTVREQLAQGKMPDLAPDFIDFFQPLIADETWLEPLMEEKLVDCRSFFKAKNYEAVIETCDYLLSLDQKNTAALVYKEKAVSRLFWNYWLFLPVNMLERYTGIGATGRAILAYKIVALSLLGLAILKILVVFIKVFKKVIHYQDCCRVVADYYLQANKPRRAVWFYRRAGDRKRMANELAKAGFLAKQAGQIYEGIWLMEKAEVLFLQEGDYGALGRIYESGNNFSSAVAAYKRAGDVPSAAVASVRGGEFEAAIRIFCDYFEKTQDPSELQLRAAKVCWELLKPRGGYGAIPKRLQSRLLPVLAKQFDLAGEYWYAATAYYLLPDYKNCRKTLEIYLADKTVSDTNLELFYMLADVEDDLAHFEVSLNIFRGIFAVDQNYRDVKERIEAKNQRHLQAEANYVPVCVIDDWTSDVPAFLFINKNTGQHIPVLVPNKRYCVRQMPTGGYHVEIQYNGRVYSKTDVEVTKELSASYNNNWYHCVVKASDGR